MKEKQDLWELVRKKLDKDNETETVSVPNKEPVKSSQEEIIREEKKDSKLQTQINKFNLLIFNNCVLTQKTPCNGWCNVAKRYCTR